MAKSEIKPEVRFSLVEDPYLRALRALRIAPPVGLGARRRSILFVALSFLPIVIWAVASGHLGPVDWTDPMLRHMGVFSRALIGFPLLLLCEPYADRVLGRMIGNFTKSGIVPETERPRFLEVLRSVERLRDSWVVWTILLGLVALSIVAATQRGGADDPDSLMWVSSGGAALDFGAQWTIYVVRPLFLLHLLIWVWRLVLCWVLFRRIAKLDLQLVPSHPDRAGGLGFLAQFPMAFSLVILAISIVLCAFAGHQIHSHGAHVKDFQVLFVSIAVGLAVLFLAPLTAFSGALRRARLFARFQYGALAGRFVHGMHARWIDGEEIPDDPVLSAPELGPAADVQTLYAMGTGMRMAPISRSSLIAVLVPAVAPMLLVISMEVPIKDLLMKILGALA